MSTQEITPTNKLQELSTGKQKGQYTLWPILGIWLAAGTPVFAGLGSLVQGTYYAANHQSEFAKQL